MVFVWQVRRELVASGSAATQPSASEAVGRRETVYRWLWCSNASCRLIDGVVPTDGSPITSTHPAPSAFVVWRETRRDWSRRLGFARAEVVARCGAPEARTEVLARGRGEWDGLAERDREAPSS